LRRSVFATALVATQVGARLQLQRKTRRDPEGCNLGILRGVSPGYYEVSAPVRRRERPGAKTPVIKGGEPLET